MTYDVSTGYGLTIFKLYNSADFYKIVEATEIVGSRRIVGSSCQKLASYDHRN